MGRGSWGAVTGSERRGSGRSALAPAYQRPRGASPTQTADVETEPEREAFACSHRPWEAHKRSPLLGTLPEAEPAFASPDRESSSKWAVPPGLPTSAAGQRAQPPGLPGSLAVPRASCAEQARVTRPSKESKHGKWEAVESEASK